MRSCSYDLDPHVVKIAMGDSIYLAKKTFNAAIFYILVHICHQRFVL